MEHELGVRAVVTVVVNPAVIAAIDRRPQERLLRIVVIRQDLAKLSGSVVAIL